MKTILAIVTVFVACSASAEQTVNVTGDAEIKVAPDQVVLSLGVEVHAKVLDEARQENDKRVVSIRAAVRRQGVEEKDI